MSSWEVAGTTPLQPASTAPSQSADAWQVAGTTPLAPGAPTPPNHQSQGAIPTSLLGLADKASGGYIRGAGETLAQMATGTVAAPLADIGQLAAMGYDVATGTQGDPLGFKRDIQQRLTYQPKTEQGKQLSGALAHVGGAIDRGAQYVGSQVKRLTNSDAAAAGAAEAVRQGVGFIGAGGALKGARAAEAANVAKSAELATAKSLYAPTADFVKHITDQGYKIPQGKLGEFLKSKNVSIANELNATRKIGAQIGLAPGKPMSTENLATLKNDAYKVYGDVTKNLPAKLTIPAPVLNEYSAELQKLQTAMTHSPEINYHLKPAVDMLAAQANKPLNPAQTFRDIQTLRDRAASDLKRPDIRASERATADAEKWLANKYEEIIQANLPPDEIAKFQVARTQLAQIHDVESVVNPVTRMVDMQKLARIAPKRPLSGALKDAAMFANTFKKVSKSGETPKSAVTPLDLTLSGMLLATGHAGAAVAEPAMRAGADFAASHIPTKSPSFEVGTTRKLAPAALRALGATAYGESQQ
jgi:hypothetical protein